MRRTYYYTCPYCGANLDPGEKCDCQEENYPDENRNAREGNNCIKKSAAAATGADKPFRA